MKRLTRTIRSANPVPAVDAGRWRVKRICSLRIAPGSGVPHDIAQAAGLEGLRDYCVTK